jgi:hypothetical protein
MKIYLAGKIARNDWRHSIVDGLGEVSAYNDEWPVLKESIFATHDYVGPFFLSFGHGESHCNYRHACTDRKHGWDGEQGTHDACIEAIKCCDVLFAFIESDNCYGTIFEIGYAASLGKRVYIAFSDGIRKNERRDMWLMCYSASDVYYNISDPEDCLRKVCPQELPKNLERIYKSFEEAYKSEVPFSNPMEIDWRLMPDGRERRQAYYCSTEWESLRQQVIERSFGYCELCKSEPIYLVHHLTYARLYKEHLDDLQGLCEKCHQRVHPSRSGASAK